MSDGRSGAGETLFVLLLGAAVGAAAGLLLAPRTGRETRRRLKRWMEDMEERGQDLAGEGREIWERVRERADRIGAAGESAARKTREG